MNHLRKERTDFRSNAILHRCSLSLKSRSIMKYQLSTCFKHPWYSEHEIDSMDSYSEIYHSIYIYIYLKKNTLQIPPSLSCRWSVCSVFSSSTPKASLVTCCSMIFQPIIVTSRVRVFMIFPESRPKGRKAKAKCLFSTAQWCWWVEDFPYFIIPWSTRFSLFDANPKVRIQNKT